jgi:DNA modification methylase
MIIELWPIDRPKPYAKNARKWGTNAVEKVASSIREYGFRQPIVVDPQDTIIIGHLRLAAAKKLELKEVPVHVARDLTPEQVKGLRLMDNRSHEDSAWDLALLAPEIADLKALAFDLSLTGFDGRELDSFLAPPDDDEKANAVPPLPAIPTSRPGDLWLLGPVGDGAGGTHRVLCGDSTNGEATARVLAGQKPPFLMVTDPPYGVEYDPEWRVAVDGGGRHALGKVANDDRVDWTPAWSLFPGDVAYVWHAGIYAGEAGASLLAAGFEIRGQIIWRKQHFVMSRGAYHWQHEPCWYAVRKGNPAHWRGDRKQTTVWDVANLNPHGGNREEQQTGHGTQKPIEVMRRPILNHTERGDAVYDPFLGSGTTLIAAEATERVCYGLEIDPQYCDVIVRRWQEFTGRQATLEATGRTFAAIAEERLAVAA